MRHRATETQTATVACSYLTLALALTTSSLCTILQGSFQRMPTESRALQSLREFSNSAESLQIPETVCRSVLLGQEIDEHPL
jgi:hypothetical protein